MNECSPENEKEEKKMLAEEQRKAKLAAMLRAIKASMGAGTLVKQR